MKQLVNDRMTPSVHFVRISLAVLLSISYSGKKKKLREQKKKWQSGNLFSIACQRLPFFFYRFRLSLDRLQTSDDAIQHELIQRNGSFVQDGPSDLPRPTLQQQNSQWNSFLKKTIHYPINIKYINDSSSKHH